MSRRRFIFETKIIAVALLATLFANDAAAWGPRAQRAIAMSALQQIRRTVDDAYIANRTNYELDMLRGAEDGLEAIASTVTVHSDEQALDAIASEIQLLVSARENGAGGYFAYRMGVLSAVVANTIIPFGYPANAEEEAVRDQIISDIETKIDHYTFDPHRNHLGIVKNTRYYFDGKRQYRDENNQLIFDDYTRGMGYDGILSKAGVTYFQNAVEAVADTWNTVFRNVKGRPGDETADTALARYYIDEIRYHLEKKRSIVHADRAYRDFVEVNPNIVESYIEVGDLYYAFGTPEAIERGVHEWKIAHRSTDSRAQRTAAKRISGHYIDSGEYLLVRSEGPDAQDTDLEDARRAFDLALAFDGTNEVAAANVSKTTLLINERRELYDKQQRFLDNAAVIKEAADRSQIEEAYGDSLSSYRQALSLYEAIGPEFPDLEERAKENISDLRKSIKSVTTEILESASARIESGDEAIRAANFETAVEQYNMVSAILNVIPDDGSRDADRKAELIETVEAKIDDANIRMKNQGGVG